MGLKINKTSALKYSSILQQSVPSISTETLRHHKPNSIKDNANAVAKRKHAAALFDCKTFLFH